ncbi:hypothetical protein [Aquiflexum lacus]|uniref:hypothetical protein n=1 Tax=Aquiflexum lacus TaxID=2483805 RepID=UPI001893D9EF|nr:hypothetical protein [Aquiflexum lacus]
MNRMVTVSLKVKNVIEMKILIVLGFLFTSTLFSAQVNSESYTIINDLFGNESRKNKVKIYYHFNRDTYWIDKIGDPLFISNAMVYSLEKVDIIDFMKGFDLQNSNAIVSKGNQISKEKLNKNIKLIKEFKEPIIEISNPVIQGDKAIVFQRSHFASTFDFLLLLKKKDAKWCQIGQILLNGEYI